MDADNTPAVVTRIDSAPATDAPPGEWPPAGWVLRADVCRMFGISPDTLKRWYKTGRLRCGRMVTRPTGGTCKIYPVAELEHVEEALRESLKLPDGFVSRDEAARMFGILPDTLIMWYARGLIRCRQPFVGPTGVTSMIYSLAELQSLKEELARPKLPEGYVDVRGACEMFGVTKAAWDIWKREGKAPRGEWGRSADNMPCRIYCVDELLRLKEEMRGADKVFRKGGGGDARGEYHIPEGWVRLQDVANMFGVNQKTWTRWEQEGVVTFGKQFTARKLKLYPLDEIKRLLEQCGKYSPPYPDPQRPGIYRIPLAGQDMERREAIIDAADLPLVEGKRFHMSARGADHHGQVTTFDGEGDARLRRIIMGVSGDEWVVGHRNGDPLDCRRANLVVRTRTESAAAKRKQATFAGRPCTSRFKGVCLKRGKWIAYIKKDRVSRSLGRFDDEIAAAEAYDEAARELFGEHARLNFPDGVDAWLAGQHDAPLAEAA